MDRIDVPEHPLIVAFFIDTARNETNDRSALLFDRFALHPDFADSYVHDAWLLALKSWLQNRLRPKCHRREMPETVVPANPYRLP